jgi:hypothetical protein
MKVPASDHGDLNRSRCDPEDAGSLFASCPLDCADSRLRPAAPRAGFAGAVGSLWSVTTEAKFDPLSSW